MSRTIRPLARSCEETACLSSASSSPRVGAPVRSSALKAKLAMSLGRLDGAHQAAELLGSRRALLGELARDLLAPDQVDQAGVHGLHAVRGTGLERRVDLVGLPLP